MKDLLLEIFKSFTKDVTRHVKHVQLMIIILVNYVTHLMINLKIFNVILANKKKIKDFYFIIQAVFQNVLLDTIIKMIIFVRNLNVCI